ncbi:unnamed protein product [Penicillium bialowiezense]
MGKSSLSLIEFIDGIPDEKLLAFVDRTGKWNDDNFLIELSQRASKSTEQVISIKGSNRSTISTSTPISSEIVAQIKVPTDGSWTAAQIREELMNNRWI